MIEAMKLRAHLMPFLLACCSAQAQNIVRGEYWIDTDPGIGAAIPFAPALIAAPEIPPTSITVPMAGQSVGFHVIGFRTQDDSQRWSLTNLKSIYVADSSHGDIVRIEYFWDSDPGVGLSPLDTVLASPGSDWADTLVAVVPWGITPFADHLLFMRSQDDRGRWSLTNLVDTIAVTGSVQMAELEERTGIAVFPNPFADAITIRPTSTHPVRVVIYDPKGQLVHDGVIRSTTTIDLEHVAAGPYQAYFWEDRKVIYTITLLKQ